MNKYDMEPYKLPDYLVLILIIISSLIAILVFDTGTNCNYQLWYNGKVYVRGSVLNELIKTPSDSIIVRDYGEAFPIGIIKFHKTSE